MLGSRKLYKTKLCILYKRGRCSRPNCNFAHGDAELRRFAGGSSSFNAKKDDGRQDHRSGDLRDKLDRRYSPNQRYSLGRDARSHQALHAQKPLSRNGGNSRSRSPVRRSKRGYRRKQHVDGESDDSESHRISDVAEDPRKEDKLKHVQSAIQKLEDDKSQLQNFLEEKIVEEHKLSSRIGDLEILLSKEQEDCKRITSKIKKLVRAHERYVKAQEELKRSQACLQQIGDQLGSNISKRGANEEDSSVNIPSDEEPNGDNRRSPRNDGLKNDALSVKKRQYVLSARVGNSLKRGRFSGLISRSEKTIRSEGLVNHSENDNKETESQKLFQNKKEVDKALSDDYKHKRGKNNNSGIAILIKGSDTRRVLPSTSIAAHAVDELIEVIETEDRSENGVVDNKANSSYMLPPPPPPIDLNVYKQYEGDDEDVDVEKVYSEVLGIDLNDEVEIEYF